MMEWVLRLSILILIVIMILIEKMVEELWLFAVGVALIKLIV